MSVASAADPLISRATDPQSELARRFLHYMKMMREVEDRIERKLYRQGKIVGGVYVGRGQEAIPVGVGLPSHPTLARWGSQAFGLSDEEIEKLEKEDNPPETFMWQVTKVGLNYRF